MFKQKSANKEILVVSHHDTDGITSAAIMIKTLKSLEKIFSVKIIKSLDNIVIKNLPPEKIIIFLDLASNSLQLIEKMKNDFIFIIDHHEINQTVPENVYIINPQLHNKEAISSAGLCYLFAKALNVNSKEMASLAVIGMMGDLHEKNLSKLNNQIITEGEVIVKRGVMLYPATRPLNRVLEYSAEPYIPGVTGNIEGVMDLLKEAQIEKVGNAYKTLIELDEDEMTRLVTTIVLRRPKIGFKREIIGTIYLVKRFGKLEDAREISAKINACSRLGESETALLFCLENQKAKNKIETMYAKYKQEIISSLQTLKESSQRVIGKEYEIFHAGKTIRDTMIGTMASILAHSSLYEEGTIIITMADDGDEKVKASLRLVGNQGRNVKSVVEQAVLSLGGEYGGHNTAAGCTIDKNKEQQFINNIKSCLEIEMIKV